MKILFLNKDVKFDKTAVAVGSFDGVHKGHTALIKKTVEKAKERGLTPAVWTFENYAPKGGAKYIIPPDERYAIFAKLGVKLVFTVRFDDVRDMSADRFVKDVLINDCRADYAVCGYNFRFGRGAEGRADTLYRLMRQNGGDAYICGAVTYKNTPVSSTEIRKALKNGDIQLSNGMLGRRFSITLPVVHGGHIGTGLGFPTVNQIYPDGLTPLRRGVYACRAKLGGRSYKAVSNVGTKPTVGSDGVVCETHIIDYDGDLYGKNVTVSFCRFIRDEKKFDSLEQLRAQIAADTETAKELL